MWKSATMEVLKRDAVLSRQGAFRPIHGEHRRGNRGAITNLSESARRNLKRTFRNCEGLTHMVTLTYPREFPQDGKTVKKHWSAMRHWLTRREVKGCWFLEFQKRGAPHFHLFIDRWVDYRELAAAWFRIAGGGDRLHLAAGSRIEQLREDHAAAVYAEKYAYKADQKEVPEQFVDVGRFWGRFGGLEVEPVAVSESSERIAIDRATGEVTASETVLLARAAIRLYNARRRRLGLAPWRDNGKRGFTAFDCGDALARYLLFLRKKCMTSDTEVHEDE